MSEVAATLAERKNTHGEFADHAHATQAMKAIASSGPSWSRTTEIERESIDMILHKIGRIVSGDPHHKDHWIDIAGYATLVADRLPKEKRNGKRD